MQHDSTISTVKRYEAYADRIFVILDGIMLYGIVITNHLNALESRAFHSNKLLESFVTSIAVKLTLEFPNRKLNVLLEQ